MKAHGSQGPLRGGPRAIRGLTMVEVMIALAVGLILTLGAVQIFISSKQGYRANEGIAQIQENGRYALHFLARDIRGGSFWGCAQDAEMESQVNNTGPVDFDDEPVIGDDGGSDTLTLRMADQSTGVAVSTQMANPGDPVVVADSSGFAVGDVAVITDCASADVFMVTANNVGTGALSHAAGAPTNGIQNDSAQLRKSYGTDAMVFEANETTYQINANGLQRTINGQAQALVDDVAGMQILYGVDADTDRVPNAYLTATEIDGSGTLDWPDVLSIRVQLLIRSRNDGVADTPQQQVWDFDGDGNVDDAPDNRLYQDFTATTSLRNRLP